MDRLDYLLRQEREYESLVKMKVKKEDSQKVGLTSLNSKGGEGSFTQPVGYTASGWGV